MYCTADEVLDMMKGQLQEAILGDERIEDPAELRGKIGPYCQQAIEDACAEVDGYIGKRYPVPLKKCPQVIRKIAKDIAVYNLASRTGIDEDDRENTIYIRYKNAVSYLLNVAKGIVNIGTEEDGSTAGSGGSASAADGFRLQSNGRLFSRDSMKGW